MYLQYFDTETTVSQGDKRTNRAFMYSLECCREWHEQRRRYLSESQWRASEKEIGVPWGLPTCWSNDCQ